MTEYKKSQYNYLIPFKDMYLIYNSFSQNLAEFDAASYNKYQNLDCDKLTDTEIKFMLDRGFIVNTSDNELERVKDNYRKLRNGASGRYEICLVMNNDCNLACSYCYQSHDDTSEITKESLNAVVEAIVKDLRDTQHLSIHFFGGEPTLSRSKIAYFVDKMRTRELLNVSYHMTTNGFNLSSKDIADLVALGIDNYQITVDGNPDVHDKQRISRDGGQTYSSIMQSIEKILLNGAKVILRINLTKNNFDRIERLFDDVEQLKEQTGSDRISFSVHEAICHNYAQDNNIYFKDRKEYSKFLFKVFELFVKRGYPVPYPSTATYCMMMGRNGFVVNYDGSLAKCSSANEAPIGHISNGFFAKSYHDNKLGQDAMEDPRCISCKFMPSCNGGCKLLDDMEKDRCNYMKYIVSDLMKLIYLRRINK